MTYGQTRWAVWVAYALLAATALAALAGMGFLDPARLSRGFTNTRTFLRDLFPPDPHPLPVLITAMFETLQIAYVGTLLGFCLALPAALLATRTLFGSPVTTPLRCC